jgi:hypothetical protein
MQPNRWITSVSAVALATLLGWNSAQAQQSTGALGSG